MSRLRPIFLIVPESILYAVFMCMDIVDPDNGISSFLKYASILICLIFAVMAAVSGRNGAEAAQDKGIPGGVPGMSGRGRTAGLLLAAAILCTAFSDYFLLFEENILPGLISFCMVQTIYLAVICGARFRHVAVILCVRLVLTAAAVTAVTLGMPGGVPRDTIPVITAAGFYAVSFAGNIMHLVIGLAGPHKSSCLFKRPVLFAVGLVLFLLCDINVLIFNLDGYINVDSALFDAVKQASSVLMWAFYLPSQVMIVISGNYREADRKPA